MTETAEHTGRRPAKVARVAETTPPAALAAQAKEVSGKMSAGFEGAMSRWEKALMNLETAFGRSWDKGGEGGFLTGVVNQSAKLVLALADMDAKVLQVASGLAWFGGKVAEGAGTLGLIGSALALTKSAAALDAAAIRLAAGGGLPGGPGGAIKEGLRKGGGVPLLASGLGVLPPVLATAAIGYVLSEYGDPTKSVNGTGGRPDIGMNPGDELPGLPGSADKPSYAGPVAPSMTVKPGEAPLTLYGSGLNSFGITGPQSPEDLAKRDIERYTRALVEARRSAAPLNPGDELPGLGPEMATKAQEKGTEAGQKAGEGIKEGLREKGPEVQEQGAGIMQRLQQLFSAGIFVPIHLQVDGASGGAGGAGVQNASASGGGGGLAGLIHKASVGGSGGFTGDSGASVAATADRGNQGAPGAGSASSAGLRVKGGPGGQAFGGGATSPALIGLAGQLQKGGGVTRFTAFNDRYHAGTGSKHAHGLAMDVTGNPGRIIPNVHALMQAQGLVAGRDYRIINEYAHPSRRATGGHVHVQFQNRRAADAYGRGMPQRRSAGPEIPASPSGLTVPEAPPDGIGRGRASMDDMRDHIDRMGQHIDKLADARFDGEVRVVPGGGLRATSVRVRNHGAMSADLGISMPDLHSGDGNDPSDWS